MMLIDVHGMIYANNLQNATKALSGKNSSRRVAQAAKFSWLSLFFSSPTAAADAAARGPSAIFAQGLVTTSGSHVVVTFGSIVEEYLPNSIVCLLYSFSKVKGFQ